MLLMELSAKATENRTGHESNFGYNMKTVEKFINFQSLQSLHVLQDPCEESSSEEPSLADELPPQPPHDP